MYPLTFLVAFLPRVSKVRYFTQDATNDFILFLVKAFEGM